MGKLATCAKWGRGRTFLNQSSWSLGKLCFFAWSSSWSTNLSLKTFSNLVYCGLFALDMMPAWASDGGRLDRGACELSENGTSKPAGPIPALRRTVYKRDRVAGLMARRGLFHGRFQRGRGKGE